MFALMGRLVKAIGERSNSRLVGYEPMISFEYRFIEGGPSLSAWRGLSGACMYFYPASLALLASAYRVKFTR